jgi:photosystem II stability/assembly factor-like uncharacterized protein
VNLPHKLYLLITLWAPVSIAALIGLGIAQPAHADGSVALSTLSERTHFHGIAVSPTDSARIYLATHHGLFLIRADGSASRLSQKRDDFMGFSPHPSDPAILYASGHPAGGGNLGVMKSSDGGRTWKQIAKGVKGPVDFHQMAISRADPEVLYGVFGGLQASNDGGHNWQAIAGAPAGLLDLSASGEEVATIYAATQGGLLISKDGGRSWRAAFLLQQPATMVQVTPNGAVYAFVIGVGLLRASDPGVGWSTLNNDFGDGYLLHLAADPANADRLYAVTDRGEVRASRDGGKTWQAFGSE